MFERISQKEEARVEGAAAANDSGMSTISRVTLSGYNVYVIHLHD